MLQTLRRQKGSGNGGFVSQIVGMHGCAAAATFLLLSFSWPLCHMPLSFSGGLCCDSFLKEGVTAEQHPTICYSERTWLERHS